MSEPYQSLERLRARVEHEPDDLFDDNAEKRFDRLLMGTEAVGDGAGWLGLEAEARKMIETRLGDEPLSREVGRVDTMRATDDASMPLVFPIQSVESVEIKRSLRDDWQDLADYKWDFTDHRIVLEGATRGRGAARGTGRVNELTRFTQRATWRDVCTKLRVTYDRGFDPVPGDILSVQVAIVNKMLRQLRQEQTLAAASPEEFQGVSPQFDAVLTEDIEQRIDQFTPLAGATQSV